MLSLNNWRTVCEVIGHEWVLKLLENAVRKGVLSHSYLFTGPDGVGKRTLALEFARHLCCRVSLPPCGSCRDCQEILGRTHPDLKLLEPENGSIKIEQIRELHREAFLAPHRSPYRIFIISDMDKATPEAANSLLKILEEPPLHSIFLLTATSPELLLPTIVSRCQVFNLRPVPESQIQEFLEKNWGVESYKANLLARLSEGCPGKAIRFIQEEELFKRREEDLEAFFYILKSDTVARLEWAGEFGKDEERLKEMLNWWILAARDMLLILEGAREKVVNADCLGKLEATAVKLGKEKTRMGLKELRSILAALHRNANLRLALDVLMLKLPGFSQEV